MHDLDENSTTQCEHILTWLITTHYRYPQNDKTDRW